MREPADLIDQIERIEQHIKDNPEEINPPPIYFWGKIDALRWALNSKPFRAKNPEASKLVSIPW